jgi:hypothetical protein
LPYEAILLENKAVQRLVKTAVAAVLLILCAPRLSAVSIVYSLNVVNGFNFNSGNHQSVGYVTSMTLGGTLTLNADFPVSLPTAPAQTQNVVAVLSSESWGGGTGDALSFDMLVSTTNRNAIQQFLQTTATNLAVNFNFQIYSYDPVAQTWFEAFYPEPTQLPGGIFMKSGNSVVATIASSPSSPPASPENWAFTVSLLPSAGVQYQLHYATSSTQSIVKPWGISLGGSAPPQVTTATNAQINGSYVTLQGSVANGSKYWFDYGVGPDLASIVSSPALNPSGGVISFTITNASPTNYYYRAMASAGSELVEGNTASFTVPGSTLQVSASPVGGGSVIGGGTFATGSTNTITAIANSGYLFTNWSGAASGTNNPLAVIVSSNMAVTANFVTAPTLQVSASPPYGGVVSGGGTFAAGSTNTITATPNSGYVFIGWSGAASGATNPLSVVVRTNLVITANFAMPPFLSSATILANGAFQFSFPTNDGLLFTVWSTTNVALPRSSWTSLGPPSNNGAGLYQFTDPTATNASQRFYQVTSP